MKKLFLFIETSTQIYKVELDPKSFDGNIGNTIAKLAHDYDQDAIYYVGGLA